MQSLKHGWGKEFLPNGDVFVGMYREGMPNGKGTYKWQNGSQYEG
jgi:1-phosphatidylinositol-4-phosphate 5-kinase